jgi:hypothetical protein
MRTYLFPILIVAALVGGVARVAAANELTQIVNSYLEIQAQLAQDKTNDIRKPARAIAVEAEKMGTSGSAIGSAARAVETARDLETAREAFGTLTDAVIEAGKAAGWKDVSAKLAFCPMANKSWLQKEEEIRNPYYGSQMLTCGEFKDLPK